MDDCRLVCLFVFFFKQKTAYEMRIVDGSSDVCSSDLRDAGQRISGRLHACAATLSGAVDRDRRDAAEAQRQERLAAERTREQAQERQQAQDREKVAEKFRTIAVKREAGTHGYGDHNSDWK